jgi:hypothetical protein
MVTPIRRHDHFDDVLNDRILAPPFGQDTGLAFWLDGLAKPCLFAIADLRGLILADSHIEIVLEDGGVDLIARERICRVEVYNTLDDHRYVAHPLDDELPKDE